MSQDQSPFKMYGELASWWPLVSDPADYVEEAAFFQQLLRDSGSQVPGTLLELGSGGGNNAYHLKAHFQMTLVDQASEMLAVSRRLNPECEHLAGDMRTVRLDRQFDAVFIHDAIEYMTSEADLRQALATAAVHCRPGGVALFVPDHIRETFVESTDHGGHDGPDYSLRYLEWSYDPDPSDSTCVTDYAFLLRDAAGQVQVAHDQHLLGLFGRDQWLAWLHEAGFAARIVIDSYERELFIGVKRPA